LKIINIKTNPGLIEDIIDLGDRHSKTLGFFPKEAFEDQAKKGLVLCALEDEVLLGYLMFRISFDRVNIVHLCVDEEHQGKHIAVKLINKLKATSTRYKGIRLKCRNDYKANSFWEKVNFCPIKEILGRSQHGYLLTVWWFEYPQNNLFSQSNQLENSAKILVAIDTNIFIDLKEKREKESLSLTNDWIDDEIELCVTREIYNEIKRNNNKNIRDECRQFVHNFTLLEFDEQRFNSIIQETHTCFKQNTHRDKSDLKQIVNAIIGGALYFVTRDEYWILQSKYFEENYNLVILRPAVFITEIDERLESSKYEPRKLAGTDITTEVLSSTSISTIVSTFHQNSSNQGEVRSTFKRKLHGYLANPRDCRIYSIKDNSKELLAFFAIDLKS